MRYPKKRVLALSRQTVEEFKGYNHNPRIGDGEFYEMENLSSDGYPVLCPRKGRREETIAGQTVMPQGLIGKDALCVIADGMLYMNEAQQDLVLSQGAKKPVSMGAYIIFPEDRKWFNTADGSSGSIDAEAEAQMTVSPCLLTGADYDYVTEEPETPENMQYWLDTSASPYSLKQWSASSGMWITVPTTYVKIQSTGIGTLFEQYDGIELAINSDNSELQELNGSNVIWGKGDDYIVVTGLLSGYADGVTIKVSRRMPEMDFVIECGNRLWGCKYGLNAQNQVVNEIYCSKLGDFKNWNCFMGVSTDSWHGSCGTDGMFTGAITHLGYPLFFKEDVMHKVFPSAEGAHSVQDTACRGVQQGCDRSLVIVNGVLYYKARSGVCRFDGSLPQIISGALGEESYHSAVAGTQGNKYYISMADSKNAQHLFVLDTAKGVWHREDGLKVNHFCTCQGRLFAATDETLLELNAGEEEVSWAAQTGPMGIFTSDAKYMTGISIRAWLGKGSQLRVLVSYDLDGDWTESACVTGDGLRSWTVPVRVRRYDHVYLRLEGMGDAKIYSLTKTLEQGSDVR